MKLKIPLFLLFLRAFISGGQSLPVCSKNNEADANGLNYIFQKIAAYQSSEPDSAVYYADKGLKLSRKLHYLQEEAEVLVKFAEINEQYGNLKLAIKYQKEALIIYNKLNDHRGIGLTDARLGILEGKQHHFGDGLKLIHLSLSQFEKDKDTSGIIRAYTELGEIYEISGKLTDALRYYSIAEQINKDRPVSDEYFALLSSIGGLHTKMGNYRKAAQYYQTGINKSNTQRHAKSHVIFLNNAGGAWNKLGDKQKALEYHQQGLQKARLFGLHEEEAHSLMAIAGMLQDKDADQSIRHLKNALTIAHRIGQKQLTAEIYFTLSTIYRQQSRYQDALEALEEHHRLLDSLLTVNKGHRIAVLQSSYELAESRLHIESLELINEERTYQRNEGILSALVILFILIILAGYFYKTKRLNQRLKESNLVKDKLFSIIGHDLRNPIGGITQLLAMMEEDALDKEHRLMLFEMRRQGETTLEILNALLSWGQSQLKGIRIAATAFETYPYIVKNMELLRQQSADKHIEVLHNSDRQLTVYGDLNHFDFIIRNLLSNAIKFSNPNSKIELRADMELQSGKVIFSVKDQGRGISKSQQDLFQTINLDVSFGTKGEKGTGLGLMLCKEFVKANGGNIWLESTEGEGSVFYFSFPMNIV